MPALGFSYNFLQGLSDFWQRFFADSDQLSALYKGSALLIGQAYLDLLSATLGVSLKDCIALDRENYQLITFREDELRFVQGAIPAADRWSCKLPDPVVSFASLDNRVVEPTTSLEPSLDYDLADRTARFRVDPTNPSGTGLPLPGYARRSVDVDTGGRFTDSVITNWITGTSVKKGDTLRILDVGQGPDFFQRKRKDYDIILIRANGAYVAPENDLPAPATGVVYVILRVTSDARVVAESFSMPATSAMLAHRRLDEGSLRVYAKGPLGSDVVEGVDYEVNYEHGIITRLTTWQNLPGPYGADYTWRAEIHPVSGSLPRKSSTGVIATSATTTRVIQIAMWAPDALVDRRTLANNFGSFIGRSNNSTEAYRSFLEGIFQLYVLGPVLERIESALNVVLNLPVVRDDGEIYRSTDLSDPLVDRILTTHPSTKQTVTYEFPKGTPFRSDLVAGLKLLSFEPLTIAVAVTDYISTPNWWHGEVIPEQLFTPVGGSVPTVFRRIASPYYIAHTVNPADGAQVGDPGLVVGGDEDGFTPGAGHPIFRHRVAFVLMDRYLKFHTFSVKFDAIALSASVGSAFAQSLRDLNELVLTAKPAHTYVFATPTTSFRDVIAVSEASISFARKVGSRMYGPDKVIFTDGPPVVGAGVWNVNDYFKYELFTASTAFPVIGTAVAMANPAVAPRRRRLVRVFVGGFIGGLALVENVDYTVNYTNCTVTRLTAWTSTTVNVVYRQLNIGNVVNAPIGAGDMPLLIGGVDPALITAAFNPTATGWDGVITPLTAPQDIGMVERALIVYPHP